LKDTNTQAEKVNENKVFEALEGKDYLWNKKLAWKLFMGFFFDKFAILQFIDQLLKEIIKNILIFIKFMNQQLY
jgi:hypothetical protein